MSFNNNLKILEMESQKSGLLLVSDKENRNIEMSETERRMLYIAGDDYNADAVYFKKDENNKSSKAQLFIYDNTKNKISDDNKIENHKRIWSSEIVPLYYIFEKTELIVVNGKKKIVIETEKDDREKSKENFDKTIERKLNFATELEKKYDALAHPYKAYFFDNDSFWETETYTSQFLTNESPFEILIKSLKDLKKELVKKGLDEILANRIIVQGTLIKYLEEKKDKNNKNIFTVKSNILKEKWEADDFVDVIKKGKLLNLFDYLSKYYNGKIFEWHKNEDAEERNVITGFSKNIKEYLVAYLNGNFNFKKKEFAIWRYYSFQYLPVELISRIYEEFLPNMSGVAYTPPFLVDFLIDEAMPIDEYTNFKNNKFKILDPSLGSGIFCVSAYKRLIDWYKINRYYKTDKKQTWDKPIKVKTLKSILKNNIFGTDIEKEAVRIAIFSLTLALLENLTPLQIFEDLKFDDLSKDNIKDEDFFIFFNKNKDKPDFDLVIGNPPFNPPDKQGKKQSNGEYFKHLQKDLKIEVSHKIPLKNIALVFLDRAILLTKKKGLTCLILPSAPLLYGKLSMDYRNHFLRTFQVPQIVDFTHLRETLFVTKDEKTGRKKNRIATVAFFVENKKPDLSENIWHIIANFTEKEKNRLFFTFDHYNFHIVNYERALNERYIWKSNLVGGGRLGGIAKRFERQKRNIKDFIIQHDWIYIRGYFVGNKSQEAKYISNKYYLPEEAFTSKGIDYSKITLEKEKKFNDISNEKVFIKPQLLIKRSISDNRIIPVDLVNYDEVNKNITVRNEEDIDRLCFRNGIVGIHYKKEDQNIIDLFVENFKSNNLTYSFIMTLNSGSMLVRQEKVIAKTDIDNLPYPEDKTELDLSEIEKVWRDDVLKYYIEQAKVPHKNPLNKIIENTEKQLQEYGNIFCLAMNASYGTDQKTQFKQGKSFETSSYIATCFHYTDKDINFSFSQNNETKFKEYFEKQTGKSQKITRIIKEYSYSEETGDIIWFIKPKQLRYWLKSIGDRDAMGCYNDILNNK